MANVAVFGTSRMGFAGNFRSTVRHMHVLFLPVRYAAGDRPAEPQHGMLHVGELIAIGVFDRVIRSHELMPADVLENLADAIAGGCPAGSSFEIKRERGDLLPIHAVAERTLDKRFVWARHLKSMPRIAGLAHRGFRYSSVLP